MLMSSKTFADYLEERNFYLSMSKAQREEEAIPKYERRDTVGPYAQEQEECQGTDPTLWGKMCSTCRSTQRENYKRWKVTRVQDREIRELQASIASERERRDMAEARTKKHDSQEQFMDDYLKLRNEREQEYSLEHKHCLFGCYYGRDAKASCCLKCGEDR